MTAHDDEQADPIEPSKTWEEKVLAAPGAEGRVAEIEDEFRAIAHDDTDEIHAEADRLAAVWQTALLAVRRGEGCFDAEEEAWDRLVSYVKSHGDVLGDRYGEPSPEENDDD